LRNTRTGATLASSLETAFTSESRRHGLLGRSALADGAALIIAPSSAIHTFFMRFPIDVLFVTREGRIVGARESLAPWRLTAAPGAFAVIELPTGTIARTLTRRNDRLACVPCDVSGATGRLEMPTP